MAEHKHPCPDCRKPTYGCRIRLRWTEPEVQDNPRCPRCARKAELEVLPDTYHRGFWNWLRA